MRTLALVAFLDCLTLVRKHEEGSRLALLAIASINLSTGMNGRLLGLALRALSEGGLIERVQLGLDQLQTASELKTKNPEM